MSSRQSVCLVKRVLYFVQSNRAANFHKKRNEKGFMKRYSFETTRTDNCCAIRKGIDLDYVYLASLFLWQTSSLYS